LQRVKEEKERQARERAERAEQERLKRVTRPRFRIWHATCYKLEVFCDSVGFTIAAGDGHCTASVLIL